MRRRRSSDVSRNKALSALGTWAVPRIVAIALLAAAISPAWAQDLPKTQAGALAYENADRMPATDFYETPASLPPGKAGALIRSQEVTDYALPKGTNAVRILYHSRDAAGRDVAASGVVLLPAGAAPKGGWPVIAWAHGTSGVASVCAPSMMKDVYYGDEGLFAMLAGGFAVVATDYAGLGTAGPHQYLDLRSQALDVINSVTAAQQAVTGLSPRWVVDGHSQGGGAAWFVAQREAVLGDPNYLGAVSVAGTLDVPGILRFMSASGTETFYAVFQAYGMKARFPQFNAADMLTAPALAQYPKMTTQGCWYYGYATQLSNLLGTSVVRRGFANNPWVRKFAAEDAPLRHRPTRPLLVLAGGADHAVPPRSIRPVVREACRLGYHLKFHIYPGLDHDPTMEKSTPDQLHWIRARFDGQPAPDSCDASSR